MRTKKITAKRLVKVAGRNKLLRQVAEWVIDRSADYDGDLTGPFRDLFHGGCASGLVGHLVYYKDTVPFARKHLASIMTLALRDADATGAVNLFAELAACDGAQHCGTADQALNFLAWYGFESAARVLANRCGYED